jgi:hypothetical protein
VFVHIIADIYIHVQGQYNFFAWNSGLHLGTGLLVWFLLCFFLYLGWDVVPHMFGGGMLHSLYLVLYKMRVNMLSWKTG